jgi:hypothetical protein
MIRQLAKISQLVELTDPSELQSAKHSFLRLGIRVVRKPNVDYAGDRVEAYAKQPSIM